MKKIIFACSLFFWILGLTAQNEEIIYVRVETFPTHQGCEDKEVTDLESCFDQQIQRLVAENFEFPQSALEEGVEGTIRLSMIIEKDGTISEARISQGIQEDYQDDPARQAAARELELNALKVLEKVEVLKPAMMKGKAVRMKYSFPLHASLKK